HESYANLVTLVKGELDKLTQAFEIIRSRVAELNNGIRRVSISNIERIELQVQESQLVEAIRQTSQLQFDMFAPSTGSLSLEAAEQQIEHYLVGTLRAHGHELNLDDLFQLEFRVTYAQTGEQRTVTEIHAFESNGTAIGVKIVVYLGLIRLLQGTRRSIVTRIPFFLDEVGSLSSNNLRQIIAYCTEHHFLPIFASPTIRSDIPHSYILQRDGDRSWLINEVILTEREHVDETTHVDRATRP
ncbi:MAG: ATP-binding protein, partial [Chloroflexia bacterium]|nr:ATP-binding protein [Chloroflexia bacterium]